jgi:hypothetical protein
MKLYVMISFWFGVFAFVVRAGLLAWAEYPRRPQYSRGQDVLFFIISAGLTLWAGWLLWF